MERNTIITILLKSGNLVALPRPRQKVVNQINSLCIRLSVDVSVIRCWMRQ